MGPLEKDRRLLGLNVSSCSEQDTVSCLKSLWKQIATMLHPDRNPNNREAAQKAFMAADNAYKRLTKPVVQPSTSEGADSLPPETHVNDKSLIIQQANG